MSALHVSDDVFAHHQKNLTVFTVSSNVHPSCCRLVSETPAGSNLGEQNINYTRRIVRTEKPTVRKLHVHQVLSCSVHSRLDLRYMTSEGKLSHMSQ